MTNFLKVKNKRNHYRDADSKSIVVDDESGLKKAKELKARINNKEKEVQDLKKSVEELKEIVLSLVEERSGNN